MKKKYFVGIINAVILILALLLFITLFCEGEGYPQLNQSQLRRVGFQGTCRVKDGEKERDLSAETLEEIGAAETLILTGHFDENIEVNEQIFIYLRRISVDIYQNGEKIYSYGGEGTHLPILRAAGNVWGNFYSQGITTEDEIRMVFHNPYPGNSSKIYELSLQRFYVGDKMQLFLHMAGKNIYMILICGMIFLIGVELLFIVLTLRFMHVRGMNGVVHCGMLFLVSSMWLLIDYSYISLIFPYGMIWDVVDTLVFISIPALALHYGRNFMMTGVKRILEILEYLLLTEMALYLLFQKTGVADGEMVQEIFMRELPAIIAVIFVCLVLEIRKNSNKDARLVLGSGILLIAFGVAGYIWYGLSNVSGASLYGVGLAIFAFVQYLIVIKYAKESYIKSRQTQKIEKELMENRIAVMLSQIQPHFLYNSISCIQELCLIEPEKAYEALSQFAHFLRGNMDSLSSTTPIPFEQELRHVKNYLALEKIRFEDRLSVRYDIAEEGFFIPALTIQPIVENAVRYGISKKKKGGTVMISTRKTGDEIVVIVSDDGVGFDTEQAADKQDGRSHIGMENVKKRLMSQCNGRMEVTSTESEGTTVKIILPERYEMFQ